MWAIVALVLMVVSAVLSVALAPKPIPPAPSTLADVNAPTAQGGIPIPVVFGTVMIQNPNVVWYGDLVTQPIRAPSGK